MEYLPEDDDICKCGHFVGRHIDNKKACLGLYEDCKCRKFDIDLKATDSNTQAEEATWD